MPLYYPRMSWWYFTAHVLLYVGMVLFVADTSPSVFFTVFCAVMGAAWWLILYIDDLPWRKDDNSWT